MLDWIWELIADAWNWVKRKFVEIINFVNNIVSWFKDPRRIEKLRREKNIVAVAIKRNLDSGNYNVINCLFDKNEGKVVGEHNEENHYAEGIESMALDSDMNEKFGDKDMIVLK